MDLGSFSLSLTVKDLAASRAFYEKLGFEVFGGNAEENWLMLRNGDAIIGLFVGMFERNMLTFTPGWDNDGKNIDPFTDVRDLQRELRSRGIAFDVEADESTTGPSHFQLTDPDGNPILVDQYR